MTNLELLRYLKECYIVSFEEPFDPVNKEIAFEVWDSDGWKHVLLWFDKEGNVMIDK